MSAREARAGGAYVEVSLRSKVQAGARQVERELSAISKSLSSFGSSLTGIGAGVTAGFGSALAALYFPTKLAADAETTQAAFEALTGSTEKAKTMLAEIRQFAASTPFNFEGLTKASQTLLAYGTATEEVIPQLKLLGDISLGNQEKLDRLAVAFGQVQAKGKLMAQEVNQMVENGFNPLQEISRTTGKSMDELFKTMESGGINFQTVVGAFKSATSEGGRFFEAMDKQSRTLTGRLAALGDEITQALLPIGQAIMDVIKPVVDAARIGVAALATITPMMKGLAVTVALVSVAGVAAGAALTVLGGVIMGIGAVISAVGTIAGAIALVWTPVTLIVLGVVGAIGLLAAGFAVVAVQSGLVSDAINYLRSTFEGITQIAKQTFAGISDAIAGGDMQLAAKILWAGLKVAFYSGLQELTRLFVNQFTIIGNATAKFVSTLAEMFINLPAMIASGIKSLSFNISAVFDSEALTNAKAELAALEAQAAKLKTDKQAADAASKAASVTGKAKEDGSQSADAKQAFDSKIKSLQEEINAAKLGSDAADLLTLAHQGVTDAQLNQIAILQAQRRELKLTQDAEERRKQAAKDLAEEGKQLTESMRSPREAFVAEIARIQKLLAARVIDQTTADRAINKAREDFGGGTDRGSNGLALRGSQAAADTIRRNQSRVSAETWVTPLVTNGAAQLKAQLELVKLEEERQRKQQEATNLATLEKLGEDQLKSLGVLPVELQKVVAAINAAKTPTFTIP
jgi:tape measure domain-containing protein